jgi:hypothetical protein
MVLLVVAGALLAGAACAPPPPPPYVPPLAPDAPIVTVSEFRDLTLSRSASSVT